MRKIVLEIDSTTAKKWEKADVKTKSLIFAQIDRFLKIALNKEKDDLWEFLEESRREAETKGFNDDILSKILNE